MRAAASHWTMLSGSTRHRQVSQHSKFVELLYLQDSLVSSPPPILPPSSSTGFSCFKTFSPEPTQSLQKL